MHSFSLLSGSRAAKLKGLIKAYSSKACKPLLTGYTECWWLGLSEENVCYIGSVSFTWCCCCTMRSKKPTLFSPLTLFWGLPMLHIFWVSFIPLFTVSTSFNCYTCFASVVFSLYPFLYFGSPALFSWRSLSKKFWFTRLTGVCSAADIFLYDMAFLALGPTCWTCVSLKLSVNG